MGEPVGYFITWTCYGTWLYGDARDSVDDVHNVYGTPYLPPNGRRVAVLRRRLKYAPVQLTPPARQVVERTIEEHCRLREWSLLAVNARSNHVHVVVRYAGVAPEVMLGEWKSWGSRRLRERLFVAPGRPVWTRHGSTRYIWHEGQFEPAVRYVLEGQDPSRFED